MNLDCTTPRGVAFVERQRQVIQTFAAARKVDVIHLAPDGTTPIDALLVRAHALVAVAEVKVRDLTLADLQAFGSYLVTFDKLVRGRAMARRLEVPYVLVVGLRDALVWWKVADASGDWLTPIITARTDTQATCNGGSVERMNAYVSLSTMQVQITEGEAT